MMDGMLDRMGEWRGKMGEWKDAMGDWKDARPEFQPGGDRAAWATSMRDWASSFPQVPRPDLAGWHSPGQGWHSRPPMGNQPTPAPGAPGTPNRPGWQRPGFPGQGHGYGRNPAFRQQMDTWRDARPDRPDGFEGSWGQSPQMTTWRSARPSYTR